MAKITIEIPEFENFKVQTIEVTPNKAYYVYMLCLKKSRRPYKIPEQETKKPEMMV